MFKPFFVHSKHQPGKLPNRAPRGFTVFVRPDTLAHGNILVHTTFCSSKDEFNKKIGRDQAQAQQPISISARMLDVHMNNCHQQVWGDSSYSYGYLYKRMV